MMIFYQSKMIEIFLYINYIELYQFKIEVSKTLQKKTHFKIT